MKTTWCLFLLLFTSSGVCAEPVNELLRKLQDARSEVRLQALDSKQMTGCYIEVEEKSCSWNADQFNQVTKALILLTSDSNPRIREYVSRYLSGSTNARTVQPLGLLLKDPSAKVRAIAASAFWTIKVDDPVNVPGVVAAEIVQQLEKLIEDTNPEVRRYAAGALLLNGTHDSLARLKKAHRSETDQKIRDLLADVIRQLEKGNIK